MIKVYSKIKKNKLLHIIYRANKNKFLRVDIAPQCQFLQVADLSLIKNKKFRPHKHIWKKHERKKVIAQESWVVIKGIIKFFAFDINGDFIKSYILNAGDISLTFEGGHTYQALSSKVKVFEFKTGPYEGIKKDKVFI